MSTFDYQSTLLSEIAAKKVAVADIKLAIANKTDAAAMNEKYNCLREIWGDLSLQDLLIEVLENLVADQAKLMQLMAHAK